MASRERTVCAPATAIKPKADAEAPASKKEEGGDDEEEDEEEEPETPDGECVLVFLDNIEAETREGDGSVGCVGPMAWLGV